jgi:hypothetical protein
MEATDRDASANLANTTRDELDVFLRNGLIAKEL